MDVFIISSLEETKRKPLFPSLCLLLHDVKAYENCKSLILITMIMHKRLQ